MGKRLALAACAFLAANAASRAEEPAFVPAEQVVGARAAVGDLAGQLMGALKAALASGGPEEALAVCKTIAPEAANQVSSARRLEIRRTALKVRNPANAPDGFERRVLTAFAEQAKAGAELAKLEHSEVVTNDGKARLRFMKAIPMAAEPCQTCHGSNIAPNLLERIRSLYPEDQATGFQPGELRGAFSVSVPIE